MLKNNLNLCYEDPPNVVQPCIFIKTPIVDNPFQHYETELPNQLQDKIDQFESHDVTPLQEMSLSFFSLCAYEKFEIRS